jgi:hypothetical protein
MGARSCLIALLLVTSSIASADQRQMAKPRPPRIEDRVAADFEAAVRAGKDGWLGLFDFKAVGEFEILLHRYDLYGRLPRLPDDVKALFAGEDATPFPAERERRTVGNFYSIIGERTVGTGGCKAGPPRTRYSKLLTTFDPLPQGTFAYERYEQLRQTVLGYTQKGGIVGIRCKGGKGGVAVVWTERPNARGYDLITVYDD